MDIEYERLSDDELEGTIASHPADECLGSCLASRGLLELRELRAEHAALQARLDGVTAENGRLRRLLQHAIQIGRFRDEDEAQPYWERWVRRVKTALAERATGESDGSL